MLNYRIEKLKPIDYEKCANIWNMKEQSNTKKWYDEIISGNRVVFIYLIDGEFIGEGALVFKNGDPDYTIPNRRIYVSRMIVKAEYRNQGIGGAILDYLIERAKELGYTEMALGVDCDNINARHLYEKKGFTTVIYAGEDELGRYVKLLKRIENNIAK